MIRINVVRDVNFIYDEGEWHIGYDRKNKDGSIKERVDYHGDLNRVIASLHKYIPNNPEIISSLVSAYKKALIKLKPLKELEPKLSTEHKYTFQTQYINEFESYFDISKTNALLHYAFSTNHKNSETGYKTETLYLTNYYQVANKILDIEVGECVRGNNEIRENGNYSDIIELIDSVSDRILASFS